MNSGTIKLARVSMASNDFIIPIPTQQPHFSYMLSQDVLEDLIVRVSKFKKKKLDELDL